MNEEKEAESEELLYYWDDDTPCTEAEYDADHLNNMEIPWEQLKYLIFRKLLKCTDVNNYITRCTSFLNVLTSVNIYKTQRRSTIRKVIVPYLVLLSNLSSLQCAGTANIGSPSAVKELRQLLVLTKYLLHMLVLAHRAECLVIATWFVFQNNHVVVIN